MNIQIDYKYETKYTLTRSHKYQSNDVDFYGRQISSRTWHAFLITIHRAKAKFHYTSWFGASSKLVRSQIPLRYLIPTSSEPASVMEFGREAASSC